MGLHFWWGVEGKERFPHSVKSSLIQNQQGHKGAWEVREESTVASLCGRQDTAKPTQVVHATALHTLT